MRSSTLAAAMVLALGLGLAACDRDSNPVSVDEAPDSELSQQGAEPVYAITHLGTVSGAAAGNGINNGGLVVGSSDLGSGVSRAVAWENGTPTNLGTLGGPGTNSSVAWPGVNTSGNLIVGISETDEPGGETWPCRFFLSAPTGNQCLGFVYENGVMTEIEPWSGGTNSFATGVNTRGQVVGWAENGVEDPTCNDPVELQFRGFILDTKTGEKTELPPLPGDSTSTGNAINNRGQVVGISGECSNAVGGFSAQHAVLWEPDGTAIDLGNLGGEAWHTPMDINEKGEVVGFGNPDGVPGDDFGFQAWYWNRHDGIEPIGTLDGLPRSQALGINDRGQVVGASTGRAFLWEDGVLRDLNDLTEPDYEGTLLYAGHINDAGVITGLALDPDTGAEVAFVATPIGQGKAK